MKRNVGCTAAIVVLSLAVGIGSCSSTKSAQKKSDQQRVWNPDYEIETYLVEDAAQTIVKLRPDSWEKIQPLVSDVLSASVGGETLEEWSAAAERGPFELANAILGLDLTFENLNRDRPSYLVFAPRRHHPWQGCLSAGLPCTLFEAPGPRYGRLILPAHDPAGLVEELRGTLGEGNYRLVEMAYHVRVEFAVTNVETEEIDRHLEVRVNDQPEDDFYGRTSPARAAILDPEVPFGVYVNLRGALDSAMYFESWKLRNRVREVPKSDRMREMLAGTAAIARMTHLDMPKQAETEDVSLTMRPGAGDSSLQVVSTRTRLGEKLSEARNVEVELPDPHIEGPSLSAEWNAQLRQIDGKVEPKDWLASDGSEHYPTVDQLGEWIWVGGWRAPSALWVSLADRYRETTGGSDLSRLVAGRIRIEALDEEGSKDWSSLGAGASVLIAAEDPSNSFVASLSELESYAGPIETEIVERTDGRIEVRMAANLPLAEVFPEEVESTSVERFALEIPGEASGVLAAAAEGIGAHAPVTSRIVGGLAQRAPLRVTQKSHPTWSAIDLVYGDGKPAAFEAPDFEIRQPSPYCLDSVAQRSAQRMEEAVRADNLDAFLESRFTDEGHGYRTAIEECAGRDAAESELANWALDYLEAWKALTRYRTGAKNWGKQILDVCDDGRDWACDVEQETWPWLRAEGP